MNVSDLISYVNNYMNDISYQPEIATGNLETIAYHLATNERKHTYNESAEEGLVQAFCVHSAQGKDWRTIDLVDDSPKTTNKSGVEQRQITLLKQDYFWKLCSEIIPNTNHYIHSSLFKLSKLTSEVLSVHGGVRSKSNISTIISSYVLFHSTKYLCYLTMMLEERLRLCFNNIQWPSDEIAAAKAKLRENPTDTATRALFRNTMIDLRSARSLATEIPEGLRETLDTIFKDYLQRDGVVGFFGNSDSPRWKGAYDSYKEAVVSAMEKHIADLDAEGGLDLASEEAKDSYKTCYLKARFVLEYDGSPDLPDSVPFMSASVWDVLCDHLKRVPKALREVSTLTPHYTQTRTPPHLRKSTRSYICADRDTFQFAPVDANACRVFSYMHTRRCRFGSNCASMCYLWCFPRSPLTVSHRYLLGIALWYITRRRLIHCGRLGPRPQSCSVL